MKATIKKVTKKEIAAVINAFAFVKPEKWNGNHIGCTTTDVIGLLASLLKIGVAAECLMGEDGIGFVSVDYQRVINHYNYRKARGY